MKRIEESITKIIDGIEVWNTLPGQCMDCGGVVFNGCRNKCPHEPITDDAKLFRKRVEKVKY